MKLPDHWAIAKLGFNESLKKHFSFVQARVTDSKSVVVPSSF